jgi:hypothetical protein
MPFVEQTAGYERMSWVGDHPGWTWTAAGTINGQAWQNIKLQMLLCPSSPLEPMVDAGGGINITRASYTGIAGATDGNGFLNGPGGWAQCCDCCTSPQMEGIISGGGTLVVGKNIGLRDITDGTSNTMVVSECSDFVYNGDYTKKNQQVNSNHGFLMGSTWTYTVEQAVASWNNNPMGGRASRLFNCTTIRYAPNSVGISYPGVGNNDGQNNGIYSAHPSGVMSVNADGSVAFTSETIDMFTLRILATRNDGQVARL